MRKPLVFLMTGAAILCVAQATSMDEQAARQAARAFFRLVDPSASTNELAKLYAAAKGDEPGDGRRRWVISSDRRMLSIDRDTGRPFSYADGVLESRAMRGPGSEGVPSRGEPFYSSESNLINRMRSKLLALGWEPGTDVSHKVLPMPGTDGRVDRSIVYVEFADRPHGFSPGRGGNTALIGVDSLSGEVIQLERTSGYSYVTPTVGVNREQAIAMATTELGGAPLPERVNGPEYQELFDSFTLTDRARQMLESKTLPLVYRIGRDGEWVLIAADNGEILGRYSTSGATDGSQLSTRKDAQTREAPVQTIAIIVAAAIGALGIWLTFFRPRKLAT